MDRLVVKARKVTRTRGMCQWHGCTNIGTELHELISRGRTKNGSIARDLSYQEELTSLLCHLHHGVAHNPEARTLLFQANYTLYGYPAVFDAFKRLLKATIGGVGITLPDPE